MTDLNRRELLAGLPLRARRPRFVIYVIDPGAAVPPTGAQAPGFYRYKVGSFECTSINDGARSFPMPERS